MYAEGSRNHLELGELAVDVNPEISLALRPLRAVGLTFRSPLSRGSISDLGTEK